MNKWFINSNNVIKGPFSSDDIKKQIRNLGDETQTTFVWSRGHTDWIRADRWSADIQPVAENTVNKPAAPKPPPTPPTASLSTPTAASSKAQAIAADVKSHSVEKFRVQYDFVDKGEMTKEQLIQFAAKQEDVSKISIYDKKQKLWREIFTLPEIAQHLGVTRRQHQRVPILAQFSGTITRSNTPLNARVITISAGGIGFTDNFDLKLGEIIQGQITSPHFYTPLTIAAEVTYAGLDGYVGLKFINMNDEVTALITDYVKRFGKVPDEP